MKVSPRSMRSTNSAASRCEVTSAPRATSMTSLKSRRRRAVTMRAGPPGNWPTMAGAMRAVTWRPLARARSTGSTSLRSMTAPKGQARMQRPQLVHFSKSISARSLLPLWMARTGQAASQGTLRRTMAW